MIAGSPRKRSPRRQALLGLALGGILVLAAVALLLLRPEPAGMTVTSVGAAAAAELADAPPSAGDKGEPTRSTSATTRPPAGHAERRRPTPSPEKSSAATRVVSSAPPPSTTTMTPPGRLGPPADPAAVALPTLGVSAPVEAVGIEADGQMQVPDDVRTVGWYRFGPAPGAAEGSAVLTGHVDSRSQGQGVFARLGKLNPGDHFTITDTTGSVRQFRVVARESWPKTSTPLDRIFDRDGQGRVVLITCGGEFDAGSRHYQDNIAITAVPEV